MSWPEPYEPNYKKYLQREQRLAAEARKRIAERQGLEAGARGQTVPPAAGHDHSGGTVAQKPDVAVAKNAAGGQFHPHSEGTHAMVAVDVLDLGLRVETFPGSPTREVPKVALVFASGERHEDGSLVLVTVEATNSMNERANLRRLLESWRGKSYTPEQAEAGVPLHKLHGHGALITVEHKRTKNDRVFANVRSISPLPKGMAAPPEVLEQYERPQYLEDRKAKYAEELRQYRASVGADTEEPRLPGDDDPDDDLPF